MLNRIIIFFTLFFVICISNISAQHSDTIHLRILQLHQAILNKNYDSIENFFNDEIKRKISIKQLSEVQDQLQTYLGDLIEIGKTEIKSNKGETNYVSSFNFRKGNVQEILIFDESNLIKGIWYKPLENKSGYTIPSYVNSANYYETEVIVKTGNYTMNGKISVPNSNLKYPAVILVWGSGPNDMNEEIGGCQPFKDLALALASQGIVVLRFDKRTYKYGMNFKENISVDDEYTEDIKSALKLLRSKSYVDKSNIYILGHSQGGMLLPYLLKNIKGFKGGISMAGASRPLGELILEQLDYLMPDSVLKTAQEKSMKIHAKNQALLSLSDTLKYNTSNDLLPLGFPGSYFIHLNKINPGKMANQIHKPILFLQGERDYQVLMTDFNIFKKYNTQSNHYFKSYQFLNHLFVKKEEPGLSNPSEYLQPGNVDFEVINDIIYFIKNKKLIN